MDDIEARFDGGTVGFGAIGLRGRRRWETRREMLSRQATTRWASCARSEPDLRSSACRRNVRPRRCSCSPITPSGSTH
ncbi:DUF4113 domain-containing protein [Luteipulveratus mongoliensis]|uniref:DUF4113 domain-containing protein n=1 Tax=Luteipulveratus mongoliensis TaxID=571913 RepID=UPI0009FB2FB9